MSTAYSSAKQKYIGNGVTTEWGFDFPIQKHSELKVYLKRSSLPQVLLKEGVDYSFVTENTIAFPIKTGEAKLQATDVLALQRESVFESEYNFSNQQRLEPEEVMHADDNLERQIQELKRDSEYAIKVQPTSNINTDEYFTAVEAIYENLDNINNVSEHSSEIITCSNNIEAIQDAPNQATSASQSATESAQSATESAQSATESAQSATESAQSATESAQSATESAQSAQTATDKADEASESARLAVSALSLQIGDVCFVPLGIDESLNLRRYLNGQVIIQSQFVSFTNKVKSAIALYPNLATTETNWQAEKTNSKLGQCGKFVVDDTAGTIRLPCVVNAQGLVDLALIGGIKSESLPNITGYLGGSATTGNYTSGSFYKQTTPITSPTYGGTVSTSDYGWAGFDASRSSSTYQDNAPVQQEAVQYPYCIVVNTGAEEAERPINNYQVNNVYSYGMSQYYKGTMNNNSWLKSAGQWNDGTVYTGMYQWLVEQMNNGVSGFVASTAAYTDYDFVINTTDQTFRLPLLNGDRVLVKKYVNGTDWYNLYSDGWIEQGGSATGIPNFTISFLKSFRDANYTITTTTRTRNDDTTVRTMEPMLGQILASSCVLQSCPSFNGTQFFWLACGYAPVPTQSDFAEVSGLYYYVGDTLQNAQLINVARIEETLVTKTNKVQAAEASMPSNRYIDLTLGASGSSYTAPANGWFAFYCESICDSRIVTKGGLFGNTVLGKSGFANNNTVSVLKGDTVTLTYSTSTGASLRFYYCEGDQ